MTATLSLVGAGTPVFFKAKAEPLPSVRTFTFTDAAVSDLSMMVLGLFVLHALSLALLTTQHSDAAKSPQLAAHFLVTLASFFTFAAFGTHLWMGGGGSETDTCITDHISGRCDGAERITLMMMAFQTYEVVLALCVSKLRGPSGEHLMHHAATLSLATIGGGYQYLHFYAPFFFGVTEISSVPLAFVDLFKFFPSLKSALPATNEHVRTLFAVCFIVMRLVYWPYVCSEFWMDSMAELQADNARQSTWVVVVFLVANVLLTGLQFFWGSLIFKGIAKKLKGEASDVKGE